MTNGFSGFKRGVPGLLLGTGLFISLPAWAVTSADGVRAEGSGSGEVHDMQGGVAEQRLRSELRLLLLDLVQSGAFGDVPAERISLDLDMPAERLSTLGVLVDSRSGSNASAGLIVLGTTPGGLAEKMGIHGGDLILALNQTSLIGLGDDSDGSALAASVLRRQFADLAEGGAVQFKLRRGSEVLETSGIVSKSAIPAVHLRLGEPLTSRSSGAQDTVDPSLGGCGRISVFDNAPTQRDLHPIRLISIDGKQSPFDGQTSFRVTTGSHRVTVAENVDNRYLGFNSRFRDNQGPSRYKSLSIDVKADITYRLATHVLPEHRNEWRDGAWWEPVVWSESSETCR